MDRRGGAVCPMGSSSVGHRVVAVRTAAASLTGPGDSGASVENLLVTGSVALVEGLA